jgi:hypothetical protein
MSAIELTNIIDRLDARMLRDRLTRLDEERGAVVVLLRAAMVKERRRQQNRRNRKAVVRA